MSSAPALTVASLAAQAYSDGYDCHGDIDLEPKSFENQLYVVIEKHLGLYAPVAAVMSFFHTLHTTDLYLTIACSQSSNLAWVRFVTAYEEYIGKVARFVSPNSDSAREIASVVVSDLFMPDRTGRCRIGSFDGQQSLAVWLRVVIKRRAINALSTKSNRFETLASAHVIVDNTWLDNIESVLRSRKYEAAIKDSFAIAIAALTEQECDLLLLRYDEALRVSEIARSFGVNPSSVTRQIQHIQAKLQKRVISVLACKYRFGAAAIKECLVEIVEIPCPSIVPFLRARCDIQHSNGRPTNQDLVA